MNKKHRKYIHRKIYRQRFGGSQPKQSEILKIRYEWLEELSKALLYACSQNYITTEVIGIQPMDGPTGTVFYLTNKYDQSRNNP